MKNKLLLAGLVLAFVLVGGCYAEVVIVRLEASEWHCTKFAEKSLPNPADGNLSTNMNRCTQWTRWE